jgi:hypothetical protein
MPPDRQIEQVHRRPVNHSQASVTLRKAFECTWIPPYVHRTEYIADKECYYSYAYVIMRKDQDCDISPKVKQAPCIDCLVRGRPHTPRHTSILRVTRDKHVCPHCALLTVALSWSLTDSHDRYQPRRRPTLTWTLRLLELISMEILVGPLIPPVASHIHTYLQTLTPCRPNTVPSARLGCRPVSTTASGW